MTPVTSTPPVASELAEGTPAPLPTGPTEHASPITPTRLDGLTSLRFIAASMIVLSHTTILFGLPYAWLDPLPLDHGVSFGFVLSGFILAYVYPSLSWQKAPRFWWARIARLWPAHLVGFLLVLVLFWPDKLAPGD